jgi:hypothetical protein
LTAHCTVKVDVPGTHPDLHLDRDLAARMISTLLEKAAAINGGDGELTISVEGPVEVAGTSGVKLLIGGSGEGWNSARTEQLFAPVSAEGDSQPMLVAFFIAYHHGGELLLSRGDDGRARLELVLPHDPLAAAQSPEDPSFLDQVFSLFDAEQLNAAG